MNAFGQDSYDGLGATMTTVNNDPGSTAPTPTGTASPPTTATASPPTTWSHEWGHAYTEYSWDGIYQWQPGALNESFSDVWGETVDLINGRMDEEEGDITAAPRGPVLHALPGAAGVHDQQPGTIAKDCAWPEPRSDRRSTTGLTDDLVLGLDADEDGDNDPNPFDLDGSIYDGCSPCPTARRWPGRS